MKKIITLLAILTSLNTWAQIPTSGLVVHYPLQGNTADSSGNGYNAYATDLSYGIGVELDANGCAEFNGSSSGVTFNKNDYNSDFNNQNYSVSLWLNLKSFPNNYTNLFEIGDATFFRLLKADTAVFELQVGNKYGTSFYGGGTITFAEEDTFTDKAFYENKWVHLAMTTNNFWGDREYKVYINGSYVGNKITSVGGDNIIYSSSDSLLQVGHRKGTNVLSLDGKIQDFFYYNRVLEASEVSALYNLRDANMPNPVGIQNVANVLKLSFSPNPATDVVRIADLPVGCQIKIVNTNGQVIYNAEGKQSNHQIDLRNIANGLYFVQVAHQGKLWGSNTMVVNH